MGVAFGGGVVRGLAHVGALSALVQAGIPIDYVAGTSVGAIVSIAYCAGWSVERIQNYADRFNWRRVVSLVWPTRGFISFDRMARWMQEDFGDLVFEDLKIPCRVVTTELQSGKEVQLYSGPVIPAIHASCAVPGFIRPVEVDGRVLCDGAVVNILPVSVLREMGADYVIGIDLMAFSIRRFLGPFGDLFGALEIILERSGNGIEEADCLIRPDLGGKTYLRFSKRKELYMLGRLAVQEKLDGIIQDLGLDSPAGMTVGRKTGVPPHSR